VPGLFIITGHYGTGKSEFSVSFALRKRLEEREEVTLVDLDIVNPYFRSREARATLEAQGIAVVSNSLNIDKGVDLPAISPAVAGSLESRDRTVIVDLGGDPVGARVMRRFKSSVPEEGLQVLYVVNIFRPENRSVEATCGSIAGVQEASGLKVTGLINNSHLLDRSRPEHLLAGDRHCREVSSRLNLPIRFVSATPEIFEACEELSQAPHGERVEIGMHLRQEWMASTGME
jgi:hypothetical protein